MKKYVKFLRFFNILLIKFRLLTKTDPCVPLYGYEYTSQPIPFLSFDKDEFNKYFLEMLGYCPSIPNIPSCARVSKSVRMSEMSLDLKNAR